MTKTATNNPKNFYMTYPNTVAIICVTIDGKTYTMPAVWQVPLSRNPMLFGVLVSPKRHTYAKLITADDYTLNYLRFEDAQLVTNLGSSSGRDINKTTRFALDLDPSKTIASPILRRAYVSLECKKQAAHTYGDHVLFVSEVTQVWWDDTYVDDGRVLTDTAQPLLYTGNFTYTTIDKHMVKPCEAYQS